MRGVVEHSYTGSIAFCASARTGLGHLRRITNIASAIRQSAPDVRIDLLSNASVEGLSAAEQSLFSRTFVAERSAMVGILAAEKPDVVAVDTAIVPGLELLSQPLALILRETISDRLKAFRLPGGRLWDDVIVAEPAPAWSPDPDAIGTRRTTNVGWIFRAPQRGQRILERRVGTCTLLIATGGGGTSDALAQEIGDIVRLVRKRTGVPHRVVQVLGPRAPRSAVVADVDEIAEVGSALDLAFADADVVISTSGYNSILELAATTTPALLCAIARTYDDQQSRAVAWAPALGLAHETGNPERSAAWIAGRLATAQRRPEALVDPSGSDRAATILLDLLGTPADRGRTLFTKQASGVDATILDARARALLASGIPTPRAIPASARNQVSFPYLEGPTAAEDWNRAGAGHPDAPSSGLTDLAIAITAPLAALHGVVGPQLQLRPLDPWRRIGPRLVAGTASIANLDERQRSRAVRLAARLREVESRITPGSQSGTIVHGDFHLGQLIRPVGREDYVLIDLDDLALGPRESDIGNCIAHIVTAPLLSNGAPVDAIARLTPIFVDAYRRHAGSELDASLVGLHCAMALLRRALKLAGRGEYDRLDDILDAAEARSTHLDAQLRRPTKRGRRSRRSPGAVAAPAAE